MPLPEAAGRGRNDAPGETINLQIGVTGAQHGGKSRRFFLATAAFTRFFKVPVAAHNFQRPFTIYFFLQSSQRFINGFTLFQLNLGQTISLPLRWTREPRSPWPQVPLESESGSIFLPEELSIGKSGKGGSELNKCIFVLTIINRTHSLHGSMMTFATGCGCADSSYCTRRQGARLSRKTLARERRDVQICTYSALTPSEGPETSLPLAALSAQGEQWVCPVNRSP